MKYEILGFIKYKIFCSGENPASNYVIYFIVPASNYVKNLHQKNFFRPV